MTRTILCFPDGDVVLQAVDGGQHYHRRYSDLPRAAADLLLLEDGKLPSDWSPCQPEDWIDNNLQDIHDRKDLSMESLEVLIGYDPDHKWPSVTGMGDAISSLFDRQQANA